MSNWDVSEDPQLSETEDLWSNPKPSWKRRLFIRYPLIGLLILFVLGLLGFPGIGAIFQMVFSIFAGWAFHVFRVIPPLFGKLDALIFPAICTILFATMTHRFVAWCLQQKSSKITWKPKHTIISVSLLLLTCSAAIAMSGIAHQLAWLSTSKITKSNRSGFSREISNLKQLGYAAFNYENDHGHYPHSIHEMHKEGYYDFPELMLISNAEIELAEPYLLLAPGAKAADLADDAMLMAGPHIYKSGSVYKVAVLRVDMSVVDMPYEDFLKKLQLQRKEEP